MHEHMPFMQGGYQAIQMLKGFITQKVCLPAKGSIAKVRTEINLIRFFFDLQNDVYDQGYDVVDNWNLDDA